LTSSDERPRPLPHSTLEPSTQRARAVRILRILAIAAMLCAALLSPSHRGKSVPGFLNFTSWSPYLPLLIAAACGLLAWALTLAGTPDELRHKPAIRPARFASLIVLMILTLNLLLLAQPAPPPPPFNGCFADYDMGRGFHHFLNCDSPEYLALAQDPSLVWTHGILQARPLSFAVPYLLAQPLRLVPRLEKAGPYRPYPREFVAYLLINLAALTVALVCFARVLDTGTGSGAGIELLLSMVVLGANDVTKFFFWTPHTQIFILVTPCLAMYLVWRVLQRGAALNLVHALALGLALGGGVLIYGAFIIPALCLAVVHVIVYRRLWPAVAVVAAALAPYAGWAAFVNAHIGSFMNWEAVNYRHFLWMVDCAREGLASCGPAARDNWIVFYTTAAPVLAVPALLLFVLRVARYIWPGDELPPRTGVLGQTIGITFVTIVVFMMLEGRYFPRLCWLLVPPVLMAVAIELKSLRLSHPRARFSAVNIVIALVLITYVALLAARQGPYT
jgi:hypothetical protein